MQVVEQLYDGHPGTSSLARSYVWWPLMDDEKPTE